MNWARQRPPSTAFVVRPSRVALLVVIVTVLIVGVACGSGGNGNAPALDNPSTTGQQLVEKYMSLLAAKDVNGLKTFLSDAFLRQGAEGMFSTKDDYLSNLPQISNYTITDVTAKQSGDALVVRWLFSVQEVIGGKTLQTTPAPRLATFVWDNGNWTLLSHANFNPPAG